MTNSDSASAATATSEFEKYRPRVLQLLRFLEGYVKLKSASPVRDVAQFANDGLVLWFADLPRENAIFCQAWSEPAEGQSDLWLRVQKQELPPCPPVPEELEPWVDLSEVQRSGGPRPKLRAVAFLPFPPVDSEDAGGGSPGGEDDADPQRNQVWQHRIEEHPEVPDRWQAYLERWDRWSQDHARKSAIQRVYASLYSAYQKHKRMGEEYELIVGLGLLIRDQARGPAIRRHTLAAQAVLEFDAKKGIISLRCPPVPGGAHVQPEDFLEPDEAPLREAHAELEDGLSVLGDAIWDRAQLLPILRGWANSIPPSPGPTFSDALSVPAGAAGIATLSWSPALILRQRTLRGTLALYRRLIEAIGNGAAIPFGLARQVDYLDDESRGATDLDQEPGPAAAARGTEEVYFPLPSNDQQRAIVDQLGRSRGVLVQGPPGTGKSQTIANLICHLLATGKRVLVTAETARALTVLKDKIPPEVRALCVSLLGADEGSFSELNAAVTGMSNRHAQWNDETAAASARKISDLERALSESRSQHAGLLRELRAFREAEAREVTVAGGPYHGTAAAIARKVGAERDAYDWLHVQVDGDPPPPLSNREAVELLGLVREFRTTEPARGGEPLLPLSDLPTPEAFAESVAAESEARRVADGYQAQREAPTFRGLLSAGATERTEIRANVQAFQAGSDALLQRPEPWIGDALRTVLGGAGAPWEVRAERTRALLADVRGFLRHDQPPTVELPAGMSEDRVRADAAAVLAHLGRGGRWSRFWIRPSAVRGRWYLRSQVSINGSVLSTAEHLGTLIQYLDARHAVAAAEELWPGNGVAELPQLETRVATLDENLEALGQVFELCDYATQIMVRLAQMDPPIPPPTWSRDGVGLLRDALDAADAEDRARQASAKVGVATSILRGASARGGASGVIEALLDAVSKRDPQAWSDAYGWAQMVQARAARLERLLALASRLGSSAPGALRALHDSWGDAVWEPRLSSFEAAWRWAVADQWLAKRRDPEEVPRLERRLAEGRHEEARLLAALAAERAWKHFLSRLTVKQQMNLVEWKNSIKAIGKGTGKGAAAHRAAALQSMAVCVEAIPIWVLPRYRVMEALDPKPDLFDCIIVDEASQMGIEGLCLWGLAKQIVVVGDPEQISPSGSFMALAPVAALAALFLKGIPFPAAFGPKASLYQHAERFKRRTVLREHFRCVPEIIGFSDRLCYAPNGTPLIPLRNYEPARLDPIQTRFVRDGVQEGRGSNVVNRPEAQAAVQQLLACTRDTAYKGKSIGVISLLGEAQARLIERMLLSALGPEEMEDRRLVCGDAYAFQGDERDVMFLSMVSAPNARIGVLGGEDAKQRFNVAVSRGRDQVWLFHSVAPEDLSDKCMRRVLLDYCLNPPEEDSGQATTFESEFERDVYDRIRAKGYRVRTQVPGGDQTTNEYRIDLVVEGDRARLAVECDGDTWHGAERYEADMYRQRQLERSGWSFIRIWASDYYRDRDLSLAPLWRELDRLRIEPAGMRPPRTVPPSPAEDVETTDALEVVPTAGEERGTTEAKATGQEQSYGSEDLPAEDSPLPALVEAPAARGTAAQSAAARPVGLGVATPVPSGDAELLAHFESVSALEWADLAQWAKLRSTWDTTRKRFIGHVSKALISGKQLDDAQRIWAARLHSLACRIGFHPHVNESGGGPQTGQQDLPFSE